MHSDEIAANPLVHLWRVDWTFDGQPLVQGVEQRGVPAIALIDAWWTEAVDRLKRNQPVPVDTRFALDATYFAERDPTRGILWPAAAAGRSARAFEFLATDRSDPRQAFISALCGALGDRGSIVVFHQQFESQRLSDLAAWRSRRLG
ncbi:MAG: DUF2779 domain-containing protein [Candidatus Acidiferrum sp.]